MRYIEERLEEAKKSEEGMVIPWDPDNPRRVLVVTTWRSGSTFLGTLLTYYSGAFHFHEPLMYLQGRQLKPGDDVRKELDVVNDLLKCRYNDEGYMKYLKITSTQMRHNTILWNACQMVSDTQLCTTQKFLEESCTKFPIHIMKTVRMRLSMVEEILKAKGMSDVRIIFLVRDPRGVMNSRVKLNCCKVSQDCIDPSRLCSYTRMDIKAYKILSQKYPSKIALVTYETLASEPLKTFLKIFGFAGFKLTEKLKKLIETHTSKHVDGAYTTFKKSSERISLWKTQLSRNNITYINYACRNVLKDLEYTITMN